MLAATSGKLGAVVETSLPVTSSMNVAAQMEEPKCSLAAVSSDEFNAAKILGNESRTFGDVSLNMSQSLCLTKSSF